MVFVAEQDGIPERELKAKLVEHFTGNINLEAAFLVRVRYGASKELKVALCLSARRPDTQLARKAASEFQQMFVVDESLDIIFLTSKQLREISQVAKPFYTRSSYQS
jgi:SseB protein C-terminal domain